MLATIHDISHLAAIMRRHTSLTSLVRAHASMQQLAVAGCARDESERKESPGRISLLLYATWRARRRYDAALSVSLEFFDRSRAIPLCRPAAFYTTPWRRLRFPLPRSLSHAGTSISSPPLILSQPLSLTPCRCPASIRANPPPRLALLLRASLRCLSVNPSNVSRSSEKRSLVSCAIPHSPLPTFDFFPRGRSSDASQIRQPAGFIQ